MKNPLPCSLFDCVLRPFIQANSLTSTDPFAEADEDTGETKQSQNYIHIRIQRTFDLVQSALANVAQAQIKISDLIPITIERNGRKTLTTVQGLPKKFDQKKILKVIKKKFGESSNVRQSTESSVLTYARQACNGTIVNDTEMGEVIQLQGDQRKDVQEFLVDKKEGLELDAKTIKVLFLNMQHYIHSRAHKARRFMGSRSYQQRLR